MQRKASALFGISVELSVNPVCFTVSSNVPCKVTVKGELTGAWLAEEPESCQ